MANSRNDILKAEYVEFLRRAQGKSHKTIDEALRAINELENRRDQKDFDRITSTQIVSYQDHLKARPSKTTGQTLSPNTIRHNLGHNQDFCSWLMTEKRLKRITPGLLAYFTVDRRTRAAGRTSRPRKYARHDDWLKMVAAHPAGGLEDLRDRAIIALLILTGVRDAALVSLRIKHLDVANNRLDQYGREVETKFGKSMWTSFFPFADGARAALAAYFNIVVGLGFGPDDPLFPQSMDGVALSVAAGTTKLKPWKTASPVRRIVKKACGYAGIPYVVPHSVRNTLAILGVERCKTLKALVAWSQNLGHKSIFTTLEHYAQLSPDEIDRVMSQMESQGDDAEAVELFEAVLAANDNQRAGIRLLLKRS